MFKSVKKERAKLDEREMLIELKWHRICHFVIFIYISVLLILKMAGLIKEITIDILFTVVALQAFMFFVYVFMRNKE